MNEKSKYGSVGKFFKFISKVISYTIFIILIILAIFLACYVINSKIAAKKGEKFQPYISLYTIISPSMTPNINVYDVVVSKKVSNPSDIKVGDVITFISTSQISSGMTVTHRVVGVVNTDKGVGYKTKGDNNLSPDGAPAEFNNVIGKVVFKIPKLGKLQEFISSKGGWIIAIVIPAVLIIISDIIKIIKLSTVNKKINKLSEKEKLENEEQIAKEEARKEELLKKIELDNNNLAENDNNIENLVNKIENQNDFDNNTFENHSYNPFRDDDFTGKIEIIEENDEEVIDIPNVKIKNVDNKENNINIKKDVNNQVNNSKKKRKKNQYYKNNRNYNNNNRKNNYKSKKNSNYNNRKKH